MKSNKIKVLEFIMEYSSNHQDEAPTLTTQYLSEKLMMQRSNLSSILNQLVKEGKITKSNGRPVLYQLVTDTNRIDEDFSKLVGYNQSLKEAVMLAKAAILYPQGSPHILITGQSGSGVKYFCQEIYNFAIHSKVLKTKSPFVVFDCKTFIENPTIINEILFGGENKPGLIHEANQGMLLLKNIELLSGYQRTMLFTIMQERQMLTKQYLELPSDFKCIIIFSIASDTNKEVYDVYRNKMDFVIELPSLVKRSLKERFDLLARFFQEEANKLERIIEVNNNILHSLLLYEANDNIRGLKNDIHTGVANCYVRQHSHQQIKLLLSDFPNYVRKGMIYYKNHKEEIDEIIPGDVRIAFTKNDILKNKIANQNIYQTIDNQKRELKKQSVSEENINNLVSLNLHQDFQNYFHEISKRVKDQEQLMNLVSMHLIQLVKDFLIKVESELALSYQENILYGLCLHLNASLIKVTSKQRLSNEEIKRMIDLYPKHYHLAKEFIQGIEQEFRVKMNIDEIIFTMLFLLQETKPAVKKMVSTLIAMHGDSSASSIVKVVNTLTNRKNCYAFDLSLDMSMDQAYEQLKKQIETINQGKGIILVYDMGSIRTMGESIAVETGIEIKFLEMPLTLIGMASSNKASENSSLDEVYDYLQDNFSDIKYFRSKGSKRIIVLIDKDGALVNQAKEYLYNHFNVETIVIHQIISDDVNYIYNEMNRLANEGQIVGLISNQNYNLVQFSTCNYEQLFNRKTYNLDTLFTDQENDDIDEIYAYLKDQFNEIGIDSIKEDINIFVHEVAKALAVDLDEDQQIGLIVHLVCLIDRINKQQSPNVNFIASSIISKQGALVARVQELLEPIEQRLNISISDSEVATIISIVKKR